MPDHVNANGRAEVVGLDPRLVRELNDVRRRVAVALLRLAELEARGDVLARKRQA